ncbi:ATP-binding cassette domain-containing protein [Vibrio bivalvicida]|uniref:ATP-binding cassette domain-containing protein n=1 Tax=Vibrio bivalvicida TaxID=1276888 RepID=A0ABV4MIJ4_9VIBR
MEINPKKPIFSLLKILSSGATKTGFVSLIASVAIATLFSTPIVMSQYLSVVVSQTIHTDISSMFEVTSVCLVLVLMSLLLRTINRIAILKVINKGFLELTMTLVQNYVYPRDHSLQSALTHNKQSVFNEHVVILVNNIKRILPSLLDCLCSILISSVLMMMIDVSLFLCIIPIIILTLYLPQKVAENAPSYMKAESKNMSDINDSMTDVFRNKEFVFTTCSEKVLSWFEGKIDDHFENQSKKWVRWNYAFNVRVSFVALISSLVLVIAGDKILSDAVTVAEFLAFYVLMLNLIPSLDHVFRTFMFLQGATVNLQVIEPFIKECKSESETFGYAREFSVLKMNGVSLKLDDGGSIPLGSFEFLCGNTYIVTGPVGVGKSTLLKTVIGLNNPTHGNVEVGSEVGHWRAVDFRDVSYVSQDCLFIDGWSIQDNVVLNETYHETKLNESLEQASLSDLDIASISNWSIGEKQRVEIARAFYKDAKIMVFDEPTSALDKKLKSAIWSHILKSEVDKIKLVVSHEIPDNLQFFANVHICELTSDKGLVKCC